MYYIFNENGDCVASCNYEPDAADLVSRNEMAVVSEESYDISKIKLVNGAIIEVIKEPTLAELKESKLSEIDIWTERKITGGFVSECSGETVTYDSDRDTQNTVSSDLNTIYLAPEEFAKNFPNGYLMRGYPKNSYSKFVTNYLPLSAMQKTPIILFIMLVSNVTILFIVYYLSKRNVMLKVAPILNGLDKLSHGETVVLNINGELEDVGKRINETSLQLDKQNKSRANWISGVSHDIRTPLSMIMGYADRITSSLDVGENTRKQANIIKIQSVKIKNLVQDLNLVSQLNYNVQPVKQTPVHLCKMIREIVVEYLNNNLDNKFDFELNLNCNTEQISIIGDERLLYRAIQNIISNSINHNENGCTISVSLAVNGNNLILVISDNGKGISEENLQKIQSTPHYLQSTDERLDLRHGLGLLLVKEIISIHNGTVSISSALNNGFSTTISLPIKKQ